MQVQSLGREDPLEEEMATYSSIFGVLFRGYVHHLRAVWRKALQTGGVEGLIQRKKHFRRAPDDGKGGALVFRRTRENSGEAPLARRGRAWLPSPRPAGNDPFRRGKPAAQDIS